MFAVCDPSEAAGFWMGTSPSRVLLPVDIYANHQIRRCALTQRHTTAVHCGPIAPGLCAAMLPDAKKYYAYARECLELAEQADSAETRQKLIELSRVWMEAALRERTRCPEIPIQRGWGIIAQGRKTQGRKTQGR
jgi:hypothetical protein